MIQQKASKFLGRTLTSANRRVRGSLVHQVAAQRGMAGYAENVCDLIGQTPMVKVNRVLPENMVADKILLKLEMQNPGGSIKDRIALSMIVEAEKRGEIAPEKLPSFRRLAVILGLA